VKPKEWGLHASGVKMKLATADKVLALTFDACGGTGKDGYDGKLISFLDEEHVPATLFLSGKWIDANEPVMKGLKNDPLFEIGNHGWGHAPCSVSAKSAYGIVGAGSVGAVVDEVEKNAEKIGSLAGLRPKFYRSATAFTDEVCPQIASALGEDTVSFSINGDGGATYAAQQVKTALLSAKPGSIVLLHMNHPEHDTAEGVIEAIPILRSQGFRFVRLSEYGLE
jgi:peptidoglycan/xylan/chitin deacetylase (PgdA/CDA1 family)